MASRAAMYCRSEKTNVTLSVTPAAASSSKAANPAGVAGTLLYDMNAFAEENTRFPLDVEMQFAGGEGI